MLSQKQNQKRTIRGGLWGWAGAAVLASQLVMGCGGPPEEALDGAERELLNAAFAKDCAEDTYRAAQRMLDEAKAASAAGNYDEARRKADAARMLAEQAKADAELNREECDRRKAARNAIDSATVDPSDHNTGDPYGSGVASGDYILKAIFFPFDEATLTTESQRLLNEHAEWLLQNSQVSITIEGHTDDMGSTDYNMALSQRRAQAVKQHLQRLGVDASRMKTVPFGEEKPMAYGGAENARSQNRRAEFVKR